MKEFLVTLQILFFCFVILEDCVRNIEDSLRAIKEDTENLKGELL